MRVSLWTFVESFQLISPWMAANVSQLPNTSLSLLCAVSLHNQHTPCPPCPPCPIMNCSFSAAARISSSAPNQPGSFYMHSALALNCTHTHTVSSQPRPPAYIEHMNISQHLLNTSSISCHEIHLRCQCHQAASKSLGCQRV